MSTFGAWKRAYNKKYMAITVDQVATWLEVHGIKDIPEVVETYGRWLCLGGVGGGVGGGGVVLRRVTLVLYVSGFKEPYTRLVFSELSPAVLVKREYFSIFGNICNIQSIDTRIIERRFDRMTTHLVTITAYVVSQYKEERSGHILGNFCRKRRRRPSLVVATEGLGPLYDSGVGGEILGGGCGGKRRLSLSDLKESYRWSTPSYHRRLVSYFTENIPHNLERPRLVLMFGVPGSGKNWLLSRRRKKNHVVVNVDDCLAMLPDYWRGVLELQEKDKNVHDWIRMFRDECHIIADQLFAFALRHRMNIVWNGTGKNAVRYRQLIQAAKQRDYVIELNGVCVPLVAAKRRVKKRRDSCGRSVPDVIFTAAAERVPKSFQLLCSAADYARIWQNSSCDTPKVLWDKQQGWLETDQQLLKESGWSLMHI